MAIIGATRIHSTVWMAQRERERGATHIVFNVVGVLAARCATRLRVNSHQWGAADTHALFLMIMMINMTSDGVVIRRSKLHVNQYNSFIADLTVMTVITSHCIHSHCNKPPVRGTT